MKQVEKKLSARLILSVLAIGLLGFTDIMLETALNVSFPILMTTFNVTSSTVQWLTSGVILLTSMVVILSPWLKKRFTNRSQFIVATLISIAGVLIDAVSHDFSFTLFGRLLQGIGGGVGMPLMYNVIFEQVPENRRGTMVGLGSLIISFAPAIGPAFGGYLTQNYGWRTVFWVVLPVQIGSLILGWLTYLWYAKREPSPLLDPQIFKFKTFSFSIAASFVTQTVNLTFNYAIPMALQIVLFQNAQVAGLALLPGALGYAFMAIVSGRLYDRYGAKLPIMIGLSLMMIGTLCMAILPLSVANMTLSFMIVQLGAGFWFGNNMTHAVSHVAVAHQNAGNSIFSATNNYSAAVGIALAAGVLAIFQNQAVDSKAAFVAATRAGTVWMFRLDILLIVIAGSLSLWALRVVKQRAL